MLYKTRSFCLTTVMRSLYFSLFNSYLSYRLVAWDNANKVYINKAIIAISKHTEVNNIKIV